MAEQVYVKTDPTMLTDEQLIEKEKELDRLYKRLNLVQLGYKILLNSLYGACGNSSFRYFNIALASSITTSGQLSIRWIERKLNELFDKKTGIKKDRVVLIDTDSVVLDLEDVVKQNCPANATRVDKLNFINMLGEKVINPYIENSFQELAEYVNAKEQKMKMKRENIVNMMISVAAKSYMMHVYDSEGVRYQIPYESLTDDERKLIDEKGGKNVVGIGTNWDCIYGKYMGIQAQKSSTAMVVRKALIEAIPVLFYKTEKELQQYVADFKIQFKNTPIEDIAFPRGITDLSKYNRASVEYVYSKEIDPERKKELKNKLDYPSQIYVKGTPVHCKGALIHNYLVKKLGLSNSRNTIKDGDKIKYVYLKTPNPIGEEVIAFQDRWPTEFKIDQYVDWDLMFEKQFMSPMEKMANPINWNIVKQSNLDDFFQF